MSTSLLAAVEQGLPSLLEESQRFRSMCRSRWFEGDDGKVFLRVNRRYLAADTILPVLELATIEVAEQCRGQGVFRQVLEHLEKQAVTLGRGVFVENTLEPILEAAMERYGYHRRANDELPSFWLGPEELAAKHQPRRSPRP